VVFAKQLSVSVDVTLANKMARGLNMGPSEVLTCGGYQGFVKFSWNTLHNVKDDIVTKALRH